MLCTGPTGTGKTLTISNKLLKNLPLEFISHFLTFSARTSANQTQDLIDSKLDKRQALFLPRLRTPAWLSQLRSYLPTKLCTCSGAFFYQEFLPSPPPGDCPGLALGRGLLAFCLGGKTHLEGDQA